MKKNATSMVAVAAMVLAMTASVFAQHSGAMKVNVPFTFAVENQRMQPGDYTIERVAHGRLRIQSSDGRISSTFIAFPTQGRATSESAHFIFHRYGGEYFLAKIWTPGQDVGWEVMQGKLEAELAKKGTLPVQTATLTGR